MTEGAPFSVRISEVVFSNPLPANLMPAFRGAVSAAAGHQYTFFHNHDGSGFHYRYPKIQYKRWHGKPSLLCVNEGVEELVHFFQRKATHLQLNGLIYETRIAEVRMREFHPGRTQHLQTYLLNRWLPLNQENYRIYEALKQESDRITMLQNVLAGNIKSFAKGIGWWIDGRVETEIMEQPQPVPVRFKGQKLIGFNTVFRTDLALPGRIGLGKGVSQGFGTLTFVRNTKPQQAEAHE